MLPEGWAQTTVGQISDIGSGNTPSKIGEYLQDFGELPWYKVGDMNHSANTKMMRKAEKYLSQAAVQELGLRVFPAGTVIFPKRGGAIATNKKRLLESPATTDLNVMGLTPAAEIAAYFFVWFAGVDLGSLSDGSNVPQVNNKDVTPLAVPFPPLSEQHRIVSEVERRLSVIEELEATVAANLKRAGRLRRSVLGRAFS